MSGAWTPWNGAPASGPKLPAGTQIRCRLRNGVTGQTVPQSVHWEHAHGLWDVVAYQVLPPANEGLLTCKPIDHRCGGWT